MRNWYARYPGDLMRDTQNLTCEQFGAYDRLMDFYYSTGRPIPDDLDVIKRLLGESKQKTRKILLVLRDFFEEKNGFLFHHRIEAEIEKAKKINEVRSESGKRGGKANARACPQPHSNSINTITRESAKVPIDFQPDKESTEFFRFEKIVVEQSDIDLFIQHYAATGKSVDNWQAMFRKWMLRDRVFKATGGNGNGAGRSSGATILAAGTKAGGGTSEW